MDNWYNEACFYHFFTFGVCNAPFYNSYTLNEYRINEVEKWIPHIKDMKCNSVLFSPIFESKSHGYDTSDYYKIDSRLGDNESFKNLVNVMHQNNLKVVLDGVFNHCGRDFFAFQDLLKNKEKSKYCSWFSNLNFNNSNNLKDPFTYDTWAGYTELPKFNLENAELKNYLFDAVKYWIAYFDIDGLRLDAAECLDLKFIEELRVFCEKEKFDFWLMGEIVNKDYRDVCDTNKLHSATNYEIFKGIYSSHNEQNLFEIAYSLDRQFNIDKGIYNYFSLYNFVDNHDQDRLATLVNNCYYLYTIYILLFTIPGIPSIYYGSEWGIKGRKGINLDKEIRPYIDINNITKVEENLESVIKKVSTIRNKTLALKQGSYQEVSLEYHKPFIFKREIKNQIVYVIINPNENDYDININTEIDTFYDELNNEYYNKEDLKSLNVNKYWARILVSK